MSSRRCSNCFHRRMSRQVLIAICRLRNRGTHISLLVHIATYQAELVYILMYNIWGRCCLDRHTLHCLELFRFHRLDSSWLCRRTCLGWTRRLSFCRIHCHIPNSLRDSSCQTEHHSTQDLRILESDSWEEQAQVHILSLHFNRNRLCRLYSCLSS